jgi:hypothetical protein
MASFLFLAGRRDEEGAFLFALGLLPGLVLAEAAFGFEAGLRLGIFAAALGLAFLPEWTTLRDFCFFAFL